MDVRRELAAYVALVSTLAYVRLTFTVDGGEIDLIEGVNNMSPNLVSLHTAPGCQQPAARVQKG
jgi:hypothetical protein